MEILPLILRVYWLATIPGMKYHPSLTCWCIHFFLPADHSILMGGSHIISHQSHFSQFVEGWAECGCRGLTPPADPGWCGIRASPCGSPDAVPEPCGEAEPMEGQVHEAVPISWLPGLGQEQAPGWPSITPAGCWHWQGWDAPSLLCHLHGLIPPQHLQQVFPRLGGILSEQRSKAGQHSASPLASLFTFPLPWRKRAQHWAPVHVQDVLTGTITHLLPNSEQPAALWQCRLLLMLCLALLAFSGS